MASHLPRCLIVGHHGIIARPGKAFPAQGFAHGARRTMLGPPRRSDMAITESEQKPKALPEGAREAMESLNAEAGKYNIWLRTQANAPAQRPWFRDTGIEAGGRSPAAASAQPDQGGAASLALAGDRPLSRPHRRDRAQIRRAADRVRRAPAVPADQSRSRRPAAGDQHDPLRGLDLQSGRRRAGAHPHAQCEPHDPVRERRLHHGRGRALRSPRAATSSSRRTAPGTTTAMMARPRWCGSTCSISR